MVIAWINYLFYLSRVATRVKYDCSALTGMAEFEGIVYECEAMQYMVQQIVEIAATDNNVNLRGKTGTGKELVSKAIHNHSARKDKPIEAMNVGSMTDELIHSAFYGHKRGSFTSAVTDELGIFERCDGGTVFLDEIAGIPMLAQQHLLRYLDYGTFTRVGGRKERKADCRIITASSTSLEEMLVSGKFRDDFYHRLREEKIEIPSLEERGKDEKIFLWNHFMTSFGSDASLTMAAENFIRNYTFPGNIRELRNAAKVLANRKMETIDIDALRRYLYDPRTTDTMDDIVFTPTTDEVIELAIMARMFLNNKPRNNLYIEIAEKTDCNPYEAAKIASKVRMYVDTIMESQRNIGNHIQLPVNTVINELPDTDFKKPIESVEVSEPESHTTDYESLASRAEALSGKHAIIMVSELKNRIVDRVIDKRQLANQETSDTIFFGHSGRIGYAVFGPEGALHILDKRPEQYEVSSNYRESLSNLLDAIDTEQKNINIPHVLVPRSYFNSSGNGSYAALKMLRPTKVYKNLAELAEFRIASEHSELFALSDSVLLSQGLNEKILNAAVQGIYQMYSNGLGKWLDDRTGKVMRNRNQIRLIFGYPDYSAIEKYLKAHEMEIGSQEYPITMDMCRSMERKKEPMIPSFSGEMTFLQVRDAFIENLIDGRNALCRRIGEGTLQLDKVYDSSAVRDNLLYEKVIEIALTQH